MRVEIEINTNCNKLEDTGAYCKYCPNSVIEPLSPQLMDEGLFARIIDELKELQFSGRLSFHFYGEPLLHPKIDTIAEYAHKSLSKADIILYTNGDRLGESKYNSLIASGVDRIVIFNPSKTFPERPRQTILKDIQITNRGGSLGRVETLDIPCFAPSYRLVIGYNGDILLCYEDVQRRNVLGNVEEKSIQEIWNSERFERIREQLRNGNRGSYEPCMYCNNQSHTKLGQVNVNDFY